jgi:hypothetical protein
MRVEQRIQRSVSRVRLDSRRSMTCSIIPDTADTAIVGRKYNSGPHCTEPDTLSVSQWAWLVNG